MNRDRVAVCNQYLNIPIQLSIFIHRICLFIGEETILVHWCSIENTKRSHILPEGLAAMSDLCDHFSLVWGIAPFLQNCPWESIIIYRMTWTIEILPGRNRVWYEDRFASPIVFMSWCINEMTWEHYTPLIASRNGEEHADSYVLSRLAPYVKDDAHEEMECTALPVASTDTKAATLLRMTNSFYSV